MSFITFKAPIKDGMIEIPAEYKQALSGTDQVEVTILTQPDTAKTGLIAKLLENPIAVDDFVPLSREEAHDRNF
ncbi:hypothetical protein VB780_02445 [Leptolyngbya sp. CCNP1308]|uniref:hypothetical protein n=1 Tax=Leptolyngbya sp. CCNP1308 TaxID=3110255 RepID=UPI002B1F88FC|nr:hypothetical protein [Leptolyngbya sp. CCNP1308]MEA5447411.1 hypothetical protein [Leptolyngbya sp. CCNP1308]